MTNINNLWNEAVALVKKYYSEEQIRQVMDLTKVDYNGAIEILHNFGIPSGTSPNYSVEDVIDLWEDYENYEDYKEYDFLEDAHTQEILKARGWNYKLVDSDSAVQLQWFSPAGQNFNFEVDRDDAITGIVVFAENFSVDEHVELWINSRGRDGVPSTVKELLDDSEDIFKELTELVQEVNKMEV